MILDAVTLDIMWNRLIATVDEQAAALMRSSFTSIVREAGDLSAGVFDRRGRMVAQAVTGTPGHINSMATAMGHFLDRFPVETLRPGDVLVTNDPWLVAGQLNDITVVTPVFRAGRVVAFFASCCHALDIGGRGLSADSRSVYEEGVLLPVMKLYDAGQPVEPIFEILRANVRTPDEVMGDLHSQITGNEVGGRQLLTFMDELGLDDIETLSDEIIGRSEAAMRERIAALPDGDYPYELTIDGFDAPIVIRVRVRIVGDAIEVDFGGTSPGVDRGINVCRNYTFAYVNYGVKCAVSPDVPNNDGSFRPVSMTAPEGCILNARRPAAVGGRHLVGHFVPSAIMGALAPALPEEVIASGFDALWDTHVAGRDPRTDEEFSFTWFASGGTGASHGRDGLSATAYPSGIAGVPVEVMENLAPLLFTRRELRDGSGGPGKWRGGLGQTMEFGLLIDEPFLFSGLYDRIDHPPPGLAGGMPGMHGRLTVSGSASVPAKTSRLLPATSRIRIEIPGGGGYGPAAERDPRHVLDDVLAGYIDVEAALRDYGVVVDPLAGTAERVPG